MTIVKAFLNKNLDSIKDLCLNFGYILSLFLTSYSQTHNNQEYSLNIFTTPVSFLFIINLILSLAFTGLLLFKKKYSYIFYLQFVLIYNHIISIIIINHPEIGRDVKVNIFFAISIALSLLLVLKVYPKLYQEPEERGKIE